MFIFSVKTSYKQVISALGCVAVIAVAVVLSVVLPSDTVVTANAPVSDSAQRIAYLQSLGYDVAESSEEVREVRIPDELDETLQQYNAAQEEVGRSLTPYGGKRVRLYTYTVTSADGAQAKACLYVYRDRLIAGDVAGKPL
ncbi:MAG: DUF4830 domain-containing protein [Clostridia bacterium]|nr:DUF4830 domain-containing protein [Clostridia bacterium]